MRLTSVRVQNYKCIEDSGTFSIGPVTCLVGKNESGKSALLQALHKLNPDAGSGSFDPVEEYPRAWVAEREPRISAGDAEVSGVLETVWRLDEHDQVALESALGPAAEQLDEAIICKGYANRQSWRVSIDEARVVSHYVDGSQLYQEELDSLKHVKTVRDLMETLGQMEKRSEQQEELLAGLQTTFPKQSSSQAVIEVLAKRLPKFLYFADYYKLPGEVAIDGLKARVSAGNHGVSDRIFLALLDMAGSSPEEIEGTGKAEHLYARLEAVQNRLTKQIFQYWSQNKHLKVSFKFDPGRPQDPAPYNSGFVFRTRIENTRHGVTVSFNERSSGFVWFFSFLTWFSQVKKNYGDNVVLLLDEPGLSLHARAQADLLRYFREVLIPNHQLIYTTHSPFMIDPEDLGSARTVEDVTAGDEILGTKVGDEVLSVDADTLFPLQAALGYDLTQTLFVGKDALLVEGPSDLLYAKFFSRQLQQRGRAGLDPRWVITPVGGVDKVGSFLALFAGNKLHVAVLTDFHEGQKKKVRELRESDLLRKGHVFSAEMYADQPEADVEDILGRALFVALTNECYALKGKHKLPEKRGTQSPLRVVKEAEEHFAVLPPEARAFSHYDPAAFLVERPDMAGALPGMDEALAHFERLFADLNELLL
jgi:predicted ATPase